MVGMDTSDLTPLITEVASTTTIAGNSATSLQAPSTTVEQPSAVPTGQQILDLVALLVLISLSTVVFILAGPGAFTAVTSVGMGLYATWRSSNPRPPRR